MDFAYARDNSPVGRGTLPRDDYVQNRARGVKRINCPGTYHGWSFFSNMTDSYAQKDTAGACISTVNPRNVTDVFGRSPRGDSSTVAGPLGIQYRSFVLAADDPPSALYSGPRYNVDQGKVVLVVGFRPIIALFSKSRTT